MYDLKILGPLIRGNRLTKSGILAFTFLWILNFGPLQAAVVQLSQSETKVTANSAQILAKDSGHSLQPNRQAAVATNAIVLSVRSLTSIPEISVLFPIIGLVIAISLTQLLRRRRIAQQRSSSSDSR